ncbi:MAG: hypothetical protein KDC88_14910 [Ignavibacteriae bacterium]|nr:hypothetical protein [Ignavibacteriota bacterium]MCB9260671.1 hypothetical protein [Ignavibacteriales bacterium]
MLNFNWLTDVSLDTARWIFLTLFIITGIIVLLIPQKYIYEGIKEIRIWHNLKLWTIVLLTFYFLIYYNF